MKVIDMHCDCLYKLRQLPKHASFQNAIEVDTNKERLQEGNVKIQGFAIWVDPHIPTNQLFHEALEQVSLFHNEVLRKNKDMKLIKGWHDIEQLREEEIGAILTLEGVDPIGNDLTNLNILYELGVRSIGLTWNYANLAADGALEPRGAGLSDFGRKIIEYNNDRNILTDVSHLSERAFWDVIELAEHPFASHSNTKRYCNHPRNLSDSQAKAIFEKGGTIHVVYYPEFIKAETSSITTITDLIKHIDHLCTLGGVKHIGLGSDFDGIDKKVQGLEDASKTQNLIEELLKYFSEEDVKGFAYGNFLRTFPKD